MRFKEKHGKYGELKTDMLRARITPSAKEGLETIAQELSVSVSEFLERLGRGEVKVTPSLGESSLN